MKTLERTSLFFTSSDVFCDKIKSNTNTRSLKSKPVKLRNTSGSYLTCFTPPTKLQPRCSIRRQTVQNIGTPRHRSKNILCKSSSSLSAFPEPSNSVGGSESGESWVKRLIAAWVHFRTDPANQLPRRLLNTLCLVAASRMMYLTPLVGVDPALAASILPTSGIFGGDLFMLSMGQARVSQCAMNLMQIGFGPMMGGSILAQIGASKLFKGCTDVPVISSLQYCRLTYDHKLMERFVQQFTAFMAVIMSIGMAWSVRGMMLPGYKWYSLIGPMAAGAMFVSWFAESITKTGIGQGVGVLFSLAILHSFAETIQKVAVSIIGGVISMPQAVSLLGFFLFFTFGAVLLTDGVNKVPIEFFQTEVESISNPHLKGLIEEYVPMKVNPQGMMPVIITMFLMEIPRMIFQYMDWSTAYGVLMYPWVYYPLYFVLTLGFALLDFEDSPRTVHEYLMKLGARVKYVRPGRQTILFLKLAQAHARFAGGVMLASLVTVATAVDNYTMATYNVAIGYASMLIVVGTIMSGVRQWQAFKKAPELSKVIDEMKGGL